MRPACANCRERLAVVEVQRVVENEPPERPLNLCHLCALGWATEWMGRSAGHDPDGLEGDGLSALAGGTIQFRWLEE